MFATTIGGGANVVFDLVAFSIFVVPAVVYYYSYNPFGLKCEYIPLGDDKDEGENVCRPTGETYTVLLKFDPGANVGDYQLNVHTPAGAELDSIDGQTSNLDEERQILYGVVEGNPDEYTEALYIKKTGSISPDGELVLIKSQGNNNTIEWIRLLPQK